MKTLLYCIWQCTWGILQSASGAIVFLANARNTHYFYHGAIVTEWNSPYSLSLGLFVFVSPDPFFYDKLKDEYSREELFQRALVHEYGHTIQSLILGPLYLVVIGLPSTIWCFWPVTNTWRKTNQVSYFIFYTESWANQLSEKVTKETSMENLVID